MRAIKFRAWNGKAMEYGGFSVHATGTVMPIQGLTRVHHESPVMQFTGLKDKNGVEIYEGDVLRHNREKYIGKVWFCDGCFMTDCEGFGNQPMNDLDVGWIEIIGNIYQNPELLEE